MAIAGVLAERSSCPEGARHGAVVVLDDRVIASGYGSPSVGEIPCAKCWLRVHFAETGIKDWSLCPAVHAEANAIINAARHGVPVKGGTLYVTKTPCGHCRRILKNAGIVRFFIDVTSEAEAL